MSMTEMKERAAPLVDRVNDAIRENPLAAGLIGAGLAWMLFGAKGIAAVGGIATSASEKLTETASSVGSAATDAASSVLKVGSEATAAAREMASGAVDSAASLVPDLSSAETDGSANRANVSSAISNRLTAVASSGREYGAAVQSRLSESLEKQPLLLGAIGLAIGAGIASTFASTTVEGEWMGEKGAAARETLNTVAAEAKDRAQEVVSEVRNEAAQQGLTADAAKGAVSSGSDKVRNVAGAARDSLTQSVKSPS